MKQHAVEPGILERVYDDGRKAYRAEVWDNRAGKRTTRTFPTRAAARSWRAAMVVKVKSGDDGVLPRATVEQAAWCFLEAAYAGSIANNRGEPYRRSVLEQYTAALRRYVLPAFARRALADLDAPAVQAFVDELNRTKAPQTVQNVVMPLRVIYRTAQRRGYARHNPTTNLELLYGGTPRDRVATAEEAETLLGALRRPYDRALYATAMYAGLRRGELAALTWADVDFEARLIAVRRSTNLVTMETTAPKTKAGVREALLPAPLVPHLLAWRNTTEATGLVFPSERDASRPFAPKTVDKRTERDWNKAGLVPIGLHECRHTCATWMIYAGLNPKEVSKRMGHSSVTITLDRYGHLLPGAEAEALGLLDGYLAERRAA